MGGWQISAGDFAAFLGPARFVFAVLASAWVLSDSRRRAGPLGTTLWTLTTLLAPFVLLPLYLAARLLSSRPADDAPQADNDDADDADNDAEADEIAAEADDDPGSRPAAPDGEGEILRDDEAGAAGVSEAENGDGGAGGAGGLKSFGARWRGLALPLGYACLLLALGGAYYVADWRSFDAHFERAKRAKLRGDAGRTIREYRAALALREDAHTRKLLGLELLREGLAGEALEEFRAAARGAEPDDSLPFHEARSLDALGRRGEAAEAYRKFTGGPACAADPAEARCAAARERLLRP